MATAEPEFLKKYNEEVLVCGICTEQYKTAKILPCQHNFCEQCLRGWVEKTRRLDCPLCRRSHQLPEGGVANLQSNFFLDQLVQQFNQRDSGSLKSICDACLCQADENDVRCVECSLTLCANCARAHKRLSLTQSHSLIARNDDSAMVQPRICCDRHTDNQVKFYCDTCEVPICLECTVVDHRIPQHNHRYLQDAAAQYKEVVQTKITQLKVKEKMVAESKVELQKMLKGLDVSLLAEEQKLKDHVTETVKRIKNNGSMLLKQLSDEYDIRKDDLTAQLKAMEINEHDFANSLEFIENVIRYGNAAQLMFVKEHMTSQMEELFQLNTKGDPVTDEFMAFQPSDTQCERKSLGAVQITKSLSDVPEFCRIGDEVSIKCSLKSREISSDDEIKADILSPISERDYRR